MGYSNLTIWFLLTLSWCLNVHEVKAFDYSVLDPDTGLSMFEFLTKYNYTYENHTVTTEDGYILRSFRLPYSRNQTTTNTTRPVALLLHGIWANPQDFIVRGPDNAIGFMLADAGYDVWLMASRGNTYGINHTTLDTNSLAFWNFSFHEVGYYDIPANIEYITNVTGQTNVTFYGHSQGGTAYAVMASARPEYNSRINLAVLLAPVVYMSNIKAPFFKTLGNLYPIIKIVGETLHLKAILPYNDIVLNLGKYICNVKSPLMKLCVDTIGFLCGPDPDQFIDSLLTVMGTYDPSGGSFKQVLHYLQVIRSGEFKYYDYGTTGNKKEYGQSKPPNYNFTAATAPIVIFHGLNDYFVQPADVYLMSDQLPNKTLYPVPYAKMNHIDFLFMKDVVKYVNTAVINMSNNYNGL